MRGARARLRLVSETSPQGPERRATGPSEAGSGRPNAETRGGRGRGRRGGGSGQGDGRRVEIPIPIPASVDPDYYSGLQRRKMFQVIYWEDRDRDDGDGPPADIE